MSIDEDWEDLRPAPIPEPSREATKDDLGEDWWLLKGHKPLPPHLFYVYDHQIFGVALWRVSVVRRFMMVALSGPSNARPSEHVAFLRDLLLWRSSDAGDRIVTPSAPEDRPQQLPRRKLHETVESALDAMFEIQAKRKESLAWYIRDEEEKLAQTKKSIKVLKGKLDEWTNPDFEGFISEVLKT